MRCSSRSPVTSADTSHIPVSRARSARMRWCSSFHRCAASRQRRRLHRPEEHRRETPHRAGPADARPAHRPQTGPGPGAPRRPGHRKEFGLLWCQPDGRPYDAKSDWLDWKAICREAGVRDAGVHDGRHTAATILLLLGIDEQTIRAVLGGPTSRPTRTGLASGRLSLRPPVHRQLQPEKLSTGRVHGV